MSPNDTLAAAPPQAVRVTGGVLRRGARVRIAPRPRGDVMDRALAGRIARVEGLDQDEGGRVHVAVVLEEDPGRDLGEARWPSHRFYFAPEELEPLQAAPAAPLPRVLVAGLGNVFLGDDGFGVAVVRRLGPGSLGPGVDVVDFGIRSMDLVYALVRGVDAAVLVDAAPRGGVPGTLYVIEPEPGEGEVAEAAGRTGIAGHGVDPLHALRLARRLGARLDAARVRIVGCEPARIPDPDTAPEDMFMALSAPAQAALDGALALVREVVEEMRRELAAGASAPPPAPPAPPTSSRRTIP